MSHDVQALLFHAKHQLLVIIVNNSLHKQELFLCVFL